VASVWLSTSGEYVAALSTGKTIGKGYYLPAAEVTFKVARQESQGER
jgi:hypothetical protein